MSKTKASTALVHRLVIRRYVLPCLGRSQKTGKPVGSRHRWPNGWGKGFCEWCHRSLDVLYETVKFDAETGRRMDG